jgi:hypothetical protein
VRWDCRLDDSVERWRRKQLAEEDKSLLALEARRLADACDLGGEVRSAAPVLEALHQAQADVVRDEVC